MTFTRLAIQEAAAWLQDPMRYDKAHGYTTPDHADVLVAAAQALLGGDSVNWCVPHEAQRTEKNACWKADPGDVCRFELRLVVEL